MSWKKWLKLNTSDGNPKWFSCVLLNSNKKVFAMNAMIKKKSIRFTGMTEIQFSPPSMCCGDPKRY